MTELRASTPVTPSTEGVTRITITPASSEEAFFGKNGPSFQTLVDAINPLNHIPIISDLMNDSAADAPSTASNLLGGALLGGPVGFAVSLINEIFKAGTGKGIAGSVVAALSGEETGASTQYAEAESAPAEMQTAMADIPSDQDAIAASNVVDQRSTVRVADATQTLNAARIADIARDAQTGILPQTSSKQDDRDKAILGLFGASAPSASRAYQNAQMMPYLKQANSQVL